MSSVTDNTGNYAIHSVAGAYVLALAPHLYYTITLSRATKFKTSNLKPRDNLDDFKKTLPPSTLDTLSRARGAHNNGLENFPLFAAAMVAGTAVGLPAQTLNTFAAQYLVSRVLFTALYLRAGSEVTAGMRSMTWAYSTVLSCYALIKAGNAVLGA